MPRSVVGVIDHFGPGGAQRQFVELMTGLASRGVETDAVVYYEDDHFLPLLNGVTVHLVKKSSRYQFSPALRIAKLLRRAKTPVAVSFLSTPAVYSELATLARPGTRLVVSERSNIRVQPRFRRFLRFNLHRLATHVVTNSIDQREAIKEAAPWLSNKVSCIYNGYDLAEFGSDHPQPPCSSRSIILAMGKVNRNKNPLGLATALAELPAETQRKYEVWWAGDPVDDSLIRAVDEIVKSSAEIDWRWLGLRQDTKQLLMQAAYLYQGSFSEGLSNSLCEALCAGVPVIASDISDHRRIVHGSGAGVVFDLRQAGGLSTVIRELPLSNQALYLEMSAAAKRFAEQNLSLNRMLDAYEQVLFGAPSHLQLGS